MGEGRTVRGSGVTKRAYEKEPFRSLRRPRKKGLSDASALGGEAVVDIFYFWERTDRREGSRDVESSGSEKENLSHHLGQKVSSRRGGERG